MLNKTSIETKPAIFRSTTIIGVKRGDKVAMGSDGQVTFSNTIMKHKTSKVRKLYKDKVLVGFAGTSADAFTLFEKFEGKLEEFNGNIYRSAVELAKLWRTDKFLRRLEALLTVMDKETLLIISGTGDVIEPDDDIIGIGSGGPYAMAAARALLAHTKLSARDIVEESLKIAAKEDISREDLNNPNRVKVLADRNGDAIYFSRSKIPYIRDQIELDNDHPAMLHIGLYVFRKDFLMRFTDFSESVLEKMEKLEQLRILENGYSIKVVKADIDSIGIDSPEDIAKAERILKAEIR